MKDEQKYASWSEALASELEVQMVRDKISKRQMALRLGVDYSALRGYFKTGGRTMDLKTMYGIIDNLSTPEELLFKRAREAFDQK